MAIFEQPPEKVKQKIATLGFLLSSVIVARRFSVQEAEPFLQYQLLFAASEIQTDRVN